MQKQYAGECLAKGKDRFWSRKRSLSARLLTAFRRVKNR